ELFGRGRARHLRRARAEGRRVSRAAQSIAALRRLARDAARPGWMHHRADRRRRFPRAGKRPVRAIQSKAGEFMSTDNSMKDWVAIVTGCGQRDGIGAATARELASYGCNVIATDIEPRAGGTDDLEALVKDLRESGVQAEAARADISDEASCKRA